MKVTEIEVFILADPPPRPDEETYVMPSPGGWGVRLAGVPLPGPESTLTKASRDCLRFSPCPPVWQRRSWMDAIRFWAATS